MISPLRFGAAVQGNRYAVHYIPNDPNPSFREFQDTLEKSIAAIAGKHGLRAGVAYDNNAELVYFSKNGQEEYRRPPTTPLQDIDFASVAFLDPDPNSQEPSHDALYTQKMGQAESDFVDKMFQCGIFKDVLTSVNSATLSNLVRKLTRDGVTQVRLPDTMRRADYMDKQGQK